MSLLGHLVRVTLAPEQAARPALPQQFANWSGAADTDELEWGEEASDPEAPRPAPRTASIDDPFAARLPSAPAESGPEPSAENSRRAARRPPAEFPEIAVPSAPPAERGRAAEAMVEKAPAMRQPDPIAEKVPARTMPTRSAPPQSEAYAGVNPPPPRRGRRAEAVEIPTLARAAPPQPIPHAAETGAAEIPVAAEPPRAIAPDAAPAPIDMPSRPAWHDTPAPVDARTLPPAPELRRDRARLEEPRVVPIAREAAPAPASQPAAPLVVPVAAAPPAAMPILAAPLVTLPDSAPVRPQLPDVHISIGRVEVRAAAAAPPRPAPRDTGSKSETLSLDAYLSRRNGSTR
jgi:hypothetical protein